MGYLERFLDTTIDDEKNNITTDGAFYALFLLTAAIRIFQSVNTYVIEIDSYTIIETAKTFSNFGSLSLMDFAVGTHPLFPFMMALLAHCGIGYEIAGESLSIFFGTITAVPIYLAGRAAYGRKAGLLAVFLFAVHPYLVVNAASVLRDSTSTFFLVSTFYMAWRGLSEDKDRYLFLSGVLAALAYLTKAEGLFAIIIVPAYIWTKDLFNNKMTIGRRVRATFSFSIISLIVVGFLVVIFSIKSGYFTLSFSKPGRTDAAALESVKSMANDLSVLGGFSSGFLFVDIALVFILMFSEAVTVVYIAIMAVNLVRFKEKLSLMPIERYYLFVVSGLLVFDFAYFIILHIFSRRYLLTVVILLMGFAGYGMKRIFEGLGNVDERLKQKGRSIRIRTCVILLIVITFIVGSGLQTKGYWQYNKSALKDAGVYIRSRAGGAVKILSDDPRVAYYADGTTTSLSEEALKKALAGGSATCPYDYIVIYYEENLPLYDTHRAALNDAGFREISIPVGEGAQKITVLECTKHR
jgi:hypothetical protein